MIYFNLKHWLMIFQKVITNLIYHSQLFFHHLRLKYLVRPMKNWKNLEATMMLISLLMKQVLILIIKNYNNILALLSLWRN